MSTDIAEVAGGRLQDGGSTRGSSRRARDAAVRQGRFATFARILSGLLGTTVFTACISTDEPPPLVARVTIEPVEGSLSAVGETLQLAATAFSSDGAKVAGAVFQWATTDGEVVTVDIDGLVRARGPGSAKITAAVDQIVGRASILVTPVPTHLAFEGGPTDMAAGTTLPEIRVALLDANGHVVVGAQAHVSLALVGGTPGAGLSGTTEKDAQQGRVSFAGLQVTKVGRYRLEATSAGFPPVESDEFLVRHLEADRLVFTAMPDVIEAFEVFTPVVEVRDRFGNRVLDWERDVTIALEGALDPTALRGPTTVAVKGGVGGFEDVFVTVAGRALALSASGPGPSAARSPSFDVRTTFAKLGAGDSNTCAVSQEGVAFCWGKCLGGDGIEGVSVPMPASGVERFSEVASGSSHACALSRTGRAFCWGDNRAEGRLGNGSLEGSSVEPRPVAGGQVFSQLAVGSSFTCALTVTGKAYCWGSNESGELGNGGTESSPVPVAVAGGQVFVTLGAGGEYACGLTIDGDAWCWGADSHGQLGVGGSEGSPVPVKVAGGHAFRAIACGADATCALDQRGDVYCWGGNEFGQLGTGDTEGSASPAQVTTERGIVSIVAGSGRACGLDAGGAALCWGANAAGELGTGDRDDRNAPARSADGLRFKELSLGHRHSCGVALEGDTYCWGAGADGQLGAGSVGFSLSPVRVSGTER